jgi:nucleotide-binding universal stress UspA family protein
MFKVIVVGTDGSGSATGAVKSAAELAAQFGAELHLVSGYKPVSGMHVTGAGSGIEGWEIHSSDHVESVLHDAQDIVRRHKIKTEIHPESGDPAKAIVRVAKKVEADLIVVGNKGMKGVKRFVLGSVPNDVAHNAPCSVMVLKTT